VKLHAPWEKHFKKMSTPFEDFLHAEATTGAVLMLATIIALFLANSSVSEEYFHFFHTQISITFGSMSISNSIHHWINDGLMTLFFFIIGLEIKREIVRGELSSLKVAILPILAAIGGMLFPALIYGYINAGNPGASGWGVPMATDIAFAIGILMLLKKRVSTSLITFLVALAIVDDIGAIFVIAFFYTEQIFYQPLIISFSFFAMMLVFNLMGIQKTFPYLLLGILMWFFMYESGVHATIAGIIAALAIPSEPKISPKLFTEQSQELLNKYDDYEVSDDLSLHEAQKSVLTKIQEKISEINPLSSRLEHDLHLPIALIVIPLFALANAGIPVDMDGIKGALFEPVSLGVIMGLILGKVIGIFGVTWLAVKSKVASLPSGSTMSQIFGVSLLGGIGFTMSIFIGDLAFSGDSELILQAKMGILIASLFAGVAGFIWLRFIAKKSKV